MLEKLLNHRVSKNLFALVAIQIVNYLFPLLALPLLARYLGVDGFGEVMILIAICAIANILTDFGFNLSATHKVSLHYADKSYVAQLLGNIFALKGLLALLAITGMLIYVSLADFTYLNWFSMLLLSGIILVQAFQCIWFFQGIEKMKNLTKATVVSKMIYLLMLAMLLPVSASINTALFCFFISQLLIAVLQVRFVYNEEYFFIRPKFSMLYIELEESFSFFLSRVAVSVYTAVNTLIIGSINGTAMAGLYSASENLYKGGASVASMFSQALYPYMAKTNNVSLLFKLVVVTMVPFALGCYAVSFFAEEILLWIFGPAFVEGSEFLRLFLFLMCITFISINIGYPGFAAVNKIHWANYTVMIGAVFHLIGISVLFIFNLVSPYSVLWLVITTESIILFLRVVMLIIYVRKL